MTVLILYFLGALTLTEGMPMPMKDDAIGHYFSLGRIAHDSPGSLSLPDQKPNDNPPRNKRNATGHKKNVHNMAHIDRYTGLEIGLKRGEKYGFSATKVSASHRPHEHLDPMTNKAYIYYKFHLLSTTKKPTVDSSVEAGVLDGNMLYFNRVLEEGDRLMPMDKRESTGEKHVNTDSEKHDYSKETSEVVPNEIKNDEKDHSANINKKVSVREENTNGKRETTADTEVDAEKLPLHRRKRSKASDDQEHKDNLDMKKLLYWYLSRPHRG